MKNFTANSENTQNIMLEAIGANSIDDLFAAIPENAKIKCLNLPEALSELETTKKIKNIASKNNTDKACFLGAGAYKRFIPACISQISGRFEFNTAYTPYQPEISQGTLQVIYEFQSMMSDLTGMDVVNASVYDAGNACAEAILMAKRITGKSKILVSSCINPEYKKVIETYANAGDVCVEYSDDLGYSTNIKNVEQKISTDEFAAFLIQMPNFYGSLEDINALKEIQKTSKTLIIACVDVVSLIELKKPSFYNADIVVGDIQSFGNPMSFGGPFAGFIATVDKYKRQLPGRIVGRTIDADGKQAFTLTLQAREQHIRRQKATSNICSNQALAVLNATVYLSVMGKNGVKEIAYLSAKNAHDLASGLKTKGYSIKNDDFFNEFVLSVDNADNFIKRLNENNILAGAKLSETEILVCTTELNDRDEINKYIECA